MSKVTGKPMHGSEPDGSVLGRRDGSEVLRSQPEQRGQGCCRLLCLLALLCPNRTSNWFVFHSSFGIGLQSSPRTDSSKVKELSKLFVHAFIVKGSKSQRMKQHGLMSIKWCAGRRGKEMGKSWDTGVGKPAFTLKGKFENQASLHSSYQRTSVGKQRLGVFRSQCTLARLGNLTREISSTWFHWKFKSLIFKNQYSNSN